MKEILGQLKSQAVASVVSCTVVRRKNEPSDTDVNPLGGFQFVELDLDHLVDVLIGNL